MGEPWGYIMGEGGQGSTGGPEPGPDQAYVESRERGKGPFCSVILELSAGSGFQNFLQGWRLLIGPRLPGPWKQGRALPQSVASYPHSGHSLWSAAWNPRSTLKDGLVKWPV